MRLRCRLLLALAALWALNVGCQASTPAPPRRPNVILISLDTLRADRLNAYGYKARRVSPNIDALAKDGLLFEEHVSAAPWTIPSHLSLLTSLSPSAHGVTEIRPLKQGLILRPERMTIAEALHDRGWRTGALTGGVTLDPAIGFGQGFDVYETSFFKLGAGAQASVRRFVEQGSTPFFLFLHTFEVHAPYLRARFLGEVLPEAEAQRIATALAPIAGSNPHGRTNDVADMLEKMGHFSRPVCDALYDGGILYADAWLGEFFAWLKQTGEYDRTLIVLTSDHGEQLGERDGRFFDIHGRTLYDEMLHVPLIMKLPGQSNAGLRVSSVTRAIDVMPTILDIVGATPEKHEMEGRVLSAGSRSATAISEALHLPLESKSIRDGSHKLILNIPAQQVRAHGRSFIPSVVSRELFDLEADPGEVRNLLRKAPSRDPISGSSRSRVHAERASQLEKELRAYVAAHAGVAGRGNLDSEALERLRALGYVK